jgi:hypothetical protein
MRSADLLAVDVVRRMHQCYATVEVPPKGGCMHFGIYNVTSSEPSKPAPSNRIVTVLANTFAKLNGFARWHVDLTVDAGFRARRAVGRAQ